MTKRAKKSTKKRPKRQSSYQTNQKLQRQAEIERNPPENIHTEWRQIAVQHVEKEVNRIPRISGQPELKITHRERVSRGQNCLLQAISELVVRPQSNDMYDIFGSGTSLKDQRDYFNKIRALLVNCSGMFLKYARMNEEKLVEFPTHYLQHAYTGIGDIGVAQALWASNNQKAEETYSELNHEPVALGTFEFMIFCLLFRLKFYVFRTSVSKEKGDLVSRVKTEDITTPNSGCDIQRHPIQMNNPPIFLLHLSDDGTPNSNYDHFEAMFVTGSTKPLNFTLQGLLDALEQKHEQLHKVTSMYNYDKMKRIPGSPVYRKEKDPFLLNWSDIFQDQSAEQVANVQREQAVYMMRPLANQSSSRGPVEEPHGVQNPIQAQQPSEAIRSQPEKEVPDEARLDRRLSSGPKHQQAEDQPVKTESDGGIQEPQQPQTTLSLSSVNNNVEHEDGQQNPEAEGTVGGRDSARTVSEAEDCQNSVQGEGQNKLQSNIEKVLTLEIDEPSDVLQNQSHQTLSRRDEEDQQQVQQIGTHARGYDNSHNEDPFFNTSSKREQLEAQSSGGRGINDESLNLEQLNDSAVPSNQSGLRNGNQPGSLIVQQQPNLQSFKDFILPPLTVFTEHLVQEDRPVKMINPFPVEMLRYGKEDQEDLARRCRSGRIAEGIIYDREYLRQPASMNAPAGQTETLSPLAPRPNFEQAQLLQTIDASVNDEIDKVNALVADREQSNEINDDWTDKEEDACDPNGDQPLQQDPKSQPCLDQQSSQTQNPEQAQQPSEAIRSQPGKEVPDEARLDHGLSSGRKHQQAEDQPAQTESDGDIQEPQQPQPTLSLGSVHKILSLSSVNNSVEQEDGQQNPELTEGPVASHAPALYSVDQLGDQKLLDSIATQNGLTGRSKFTGSINVLLNNVNEEQEKYWEQQVVNGRNKQSDHSAGNSKKNRPASGQPTQQNGIISATECVTFQGSDVVANETETFGGNNAIGHQDKGVGAPHPSGQKGSLQISHGQRPQKEIGDNAIQQSIRKKVHSPASKQSLKTQIFAIDNRESEINGTVTPESRKAGQALAQHRELVDDGEVKTYGDYAQTDFGREKALAQSRGLPPPSKPTSQKSKARQSSTTAQRQRPKQPQVNQSNVEQQADSSQQSLKRVTRSKAVNRPVNGQIGENPSTEDRTDKRTLDDGRFDVPKNVKTPKRQKQYEEPISQDSTKQIDTTDPKYNVSQKIHSQSQKDQVEVQAGSLKAAQQVANQSSHRNLCQSQSSDSDVIKSENSSCQSQDYRSAANQQAFTENLKNSQPQQQYPSTSHCPQLGLKEEEDKQNGEEVSKQKFRRLIREYLGHILASCQRQKPDPIVNLDEECTVELMKRVFFKDCAQHQSKWLREKTDKLFTKRSFDKEEKDRMKVQLSDKILAMVLKYYHETGKYRAMQILNGDGQLVCYSQKEIADYYKEYARSLSELVAIVKPYSNRSQEDIGEVIEQVMDGLKPHFSKDTKMSIDQKIRDYLKSKKLSVLREGTYVLDLDAGRTEEEKQQIREQRHQRRKREKDNPLKVRKNQVASSRSELVTMINSIRPLNSLFALVKDGGGALEKKYWQDSEVTELLELLWSTLPTETQEENVERRDFWLYLLISYYLCKAPTVLASHFKALFGFEHVGYGADKERNYKELYTCKNNCGYVNIAKSRKDLEENIKPAHELICGTPIYTYHFMTHPLQFKFLRNNANSKQAARRCLICLKRFMKSEDIDLQIFEHANEHTDKERALFGCYKLRTITAEQWREERNLTIAELEKMSIHQDLVDKIWIAPNQKGQKNGRAQASILKKRMANRPQLEDLDEASVTASKRQRIEQKGSSVSKVLRSSSRLLSGGISVQENKPRPQTTVKATAWSKKPKSSICMQAITQSQPSQKVNQRSKPIKKKSNCQSKRKALKTKVKKANQSNDRYCSKKGAESASSSQE